MGSPLLKWMSGCKLLVNPSKLDISITSASND